MNIKQNWQGFLGLVGLTILLSGVTACSTQTGPNDGPLVDTLQTHNITVYESPT